MTKTLNQLNPTTTLADDDLLLARDTSAAEDKKIEVSNFRETTGINARVIRLDDMTSFQNVAAVNLVDNYQFSTIGYNLGSDEGGADWYFDSTRSKNDHDGVFVVSRTVPWDGLPGTAAAFRAGTGETDPGGAGVFVSKESEVVSIARFGAKHSDVSFDNFSIIKAAFESGKVVVFPFNKTFTCLSTGEVTADEIRVIGNGSVLAFDPALSKGLHIKGIVVGTTTLSADANLFDLALSVTSAAGITKDTFLVVRDTTNSSFSGYRPEYRKGDIVRVRGVSGSTVTLDGPIEKEILAINSEVVIVTPVKLDIDGLTVTKDGSGVGQTVWLDYIWDSQIKGLKGVNGAVSIRIKHALDSDLYSCKADNTFAFEAPETDGYGISYLNCKNITDNDGRYSTVNNHALDTSGGVEHQHQSSNIVVNRGVLFGGNWAASHHGDSENCKFVNCVAEGVILGGDNPKFIDGVILVNVTKLSNAGLTSIPAARATELLNAQLDVSGNTIIISNDNKDPASTLNFVQTIGSNMIGASTVDGGIIRVVGNTCRYLGNRDAAVDGDFIAFQLGASSVAPLAVRESTDIIFEDNTVDFGSGTFITAYQLIDFGDAKVSANRWLTPETAIRRRLVQNNNGDVVTDEKMVNNLVHDFGNQVTLVNGTETTLYESAGTESTFEVVSGVLTGLSTQIRCYSDGVLVYDAGQNSATGDTSDGAGTGTYIIPRITGGKSVKVTATAFSANRVVGWSIVHKT